MPSGGARAGAGRKPKGETFARPIARAEKRVADKLPDLIDNLFRLADGGFELGADTLEPAGSITVGSGKDQSLAFPDMDPATLVVVSQTRSIAAPDRAANIYLVDRILGKPTERQEVTGKDGAGLGDSLTEDERTARILAVVQRARERAAGPVDPDEPDLGATAGPTD